MFNVHVLHHILGHYFGVKIDKQTSYWSKSGFFFSVKNDNKFSSQNIVVSSQNNVPKYRIKEQEQVLILIICTCLHSLVHSISYSKNSRFLKTASLLTYFNLNIYSHELNYNIATNSFMPLQFLKNLKMCPKFCERHLKTMLTR